MTREDVVQAALTVERWCAEHHDGLTGATCDCPFALYDSCVLFSDDVPITWELEEFLRSRGLKHD